MQAAHQPEFSTAGFYELANSGREKYIPWIRRGDSTKEPLQVQKRPTLMTGTGKWFPCPTALNMYRLRPVDVSISGEVWYRKHFTPADELKAKTFTAFRSYHGESKVFVND